MYNRFLPLKKNTDFRFIYNKGRSISTKYVVMYYKEVKDLNSQGKVGFVVSKKVGKAIVRNKYKRMMKEIFRVSDIKTNKSVDLIFLARPKIVEADYQTIKKDIIYLVKKFNKIIMVNRNE